MLKEKSGSSGVRMRRLWLACGFCAALAMPALGQGTAEEPEVNVSEYGTVDLAVQDTDLAQVLQMLAIQSKKNIIASKSVSATVTANLFDVTFKEALDSILRVNGYDYVEEGNFIYVYTIDELQAIELAQRTTDSRIFELEYLSAADAQEFITPLLSDVGQSAYLGEVPTGFKPDIGDGGADSYAYAAKLVVNDYPENMESIASLLAEVDTPPEQVLVEATILQTLLDEANAWGVDFSVIADMDFTDLAAPLTAVNALIAGDDDDIGFQPPNNEAFGLASTVGNTSGPAGLKIGVISNDVSVFVRVLDEVADTTVLARPKIMALNRQRAEVLVGARVGYLSTTATETTTTQSVEFLDTGIQLVFRPFVSPDGMVRMELAPSVSEASLRTVTDANGLIVTIPDELTNELTTNVRIRDGETLVLGGLFRESTRVGRRQIPFLGDIPLLGIPFRGQDDTAERDEIIFLITPTIVKDEVLWEAGEDGLAMADSLRVGARNGLLIFSRERRISNYNRDALAAYQRGDTEMALHYANKSLSLDPTQPKMIKLRAEITGQKIDPFEHSIMERIMRDAMGPITAAEPAPFRRMSVPPASAWRDDEPVTGDSQSFKPEPHAAVPAGSASDESWTDESDDVEWTSDPWASESGNQGGQESSETSITAVQDEPLSSSGWDATTTDVQTDSRWDSATTDFEPASTDWDSGSDWQASSSDDYSSDGESVMYETASYGDPFDSPSSAMAEVEPYETESYQTESYETESYGDPFDSPSSGAMASSTDYDDYDYATPTSSEDVVAVGHEQYFTRYFRRSIFGFWLPAEPSAFDDFAGVSDTNVNY